MRVELRGVRQCLNLKHPNLVSIFDIRTDTEVVPLTRGTLSAGSDNVVNQAEAARGLTITGTDEQPESPAATRAAATRAAPTNR